MGKATVKIEEEVKDAAAVFGDDFEADFEESTKEDDSRLEEIDATEEKDSPKEATPEEESEKYKDSGWGPDPCVPDQFAEHAWSVRNSDPVTITCDTSDPEQLNQLNTIRGMAKVQKCPRAIIDEYEKNFFEGKYFVYLVYRKVEYQQFA